MPECFFFRSEATIVSGEAANEILARRDQDLDRGFAAHNRSFATKRKPAASQGSLSNCSIKLRSEISPIRRRVGGVRQFPSTVYNEVLLLYTFFNLKDSIIVL